MHDGTRVHAAYGTTNLSRAGNKSKHSTVYSRGGIAAKQYYSRQCKCDN